MKPIYALLNWFRHAFRINRPGDWMERNSSQVVAGAPALKPVSTQQVLFDYTPDEEFEKIANTPIMNPVIAFHEALTCEDTNKLSDDNPFKGKKIEVEEAHIYEACVDERGHLLTDKKILKHREALIPFRVRRVDGSQYKRLVREATKLHDAFPEFTKRTREAQRKFLKRLNKLHEAKFFEDINFAQDASSTPYDSAQYTEFTPLYGGPFNKQLYITDYLTMHARAFEQKNHHPIAKRIIDVFAQYSFGRRFKVRWKDKKKEAVWQRFNKKFKIIHRCSEFWIREYLTYGELMVNKETWQSIDPSTVWDIITAPDDITKVFYYYQTYSTAYQTFTGYRVPGAPGSEKQQSVKYIVRQIPAPQLMHLKGNVMSQEKRGRSILFPILGWLKRVKDLYDAQVVRAQLQACFVWDITVKGNANDVNSFISQYAAMPKKATDFIHNEAVTRQALPAMPNAERAGGGVADELLAFIATAMGIPKDFFNIISTGGGSRATALVGAEPFEKAIEDLQAKFEQLLLEIAEEAIEAEGMDFEEGDVEFIFPSVTKDTTSETIKNIGIGEEMGYIDHQIAGEMYAAELNITNYDFDVVQKRVADNQKQNADPLMPNASRFGNPNGNGQDGVVHDDESPIHGNGKADLKGQLNTL